ncbi:lytic transglycosylase domain-containing protein [Limnohabitans sp. JUR4]|uniref:Lytic transglycosylase domain-containing protein n=2 Tax=Limnohabitans radicicola TaxID=2771427 RepID=A0A927IL64_9BURK|nr:lytic transglycosylase domain-containing protein [Limnohabitans radicicola]
MSTPQSMRQILRMILSDAARGLFLVTHSSLAMVGVTAAACVLALWLQPQWLKATENWVLGWLREQQVLVSWLPENRLDRATAIDLGELPPKQAAVAEWLARKYRVAPEPVAALVLEAHALSRSSKLPANLILAVMAVESSFHPYIQSHAGAQGLMQVMTGIHAKRYEAYGGNMAAFDPRTNMRVGVAVLVDGIKLKGGSIEEGLRFYLGGDAVSDDGGYVAKVLAEQARLDQVAAGVKVPVQ